MFDSAIGGGDLAFGGHQLALAFLGVGDVAAGSDHAIGTVGGVAERDAVLARPAPGLVGRAIAKLALEARAVMLEMGDQYPPMQIAIAGMDKAGPIIERETFAGSDAQQRPQRRREVDLSGADVPVIQAFVERLEGEGEAFFVASVLTLRLAGGDVGEPRRHHLAFALLERGDIAGGTDETQGATILTALGNAGLPRPAPGVGSGPIAHLAIEARRLALEMARHGTAIDRQVVGMDAAEPVLGSGEFSGGEAEHDS